MAEFVSRGFINATILQSLNLLTSDDTDETLFAAVLGYIMSRMYLAQILPGRHNHLVLGETSSTYIANKPDSRNFFERLLFKCIY